QDVVIGAGFTQSGYDPSLFLRTSEHGIVIVLVYVDDLLLTGSNDTGISALKEVLKSSFKMKDLGNLTYFLGLEFSRSIRGILVS
ncbi:reverse transcriptase domain-containing protein, partial [Mycobacterium kansasii]